MQLRVAVRSFGFKIKTWLLIDVLFLEIFYLWNDSLQLKENRFSIPNSHFCLIRFASRRKIKRNIDDWRTSES